MTKFDHRMIFGLVSAILLAGAWISPDFLNDNNSFLKDFVNHEFLSFIGVIVTITLASCANIYALLRRMEKDIGAECFGGTKTSVKNSAFSLVAVLVASLVLVVVKGAIPSEHGTVLAVINTLAILLCLWGSLVILDITRMSFKM